MRDAALDARVEQQAEAPGVAVQLDQALEQSPAGQAQSATRDRTIDLCFLGFGRDKAEFRATIGEWLIGVGRPSLFYEDDARTGASLDCVVFCRNFNTSAARVAGDALALSSRARHILIVPACGETDLSSEDAEPSVIGFQATCGLPCRGDDIEIGDQTIGETILRQAHGVRESLVATGGFGHSRVKAFSLGGGVTAALDASTLSLVMSQEGREFGPVVLSRNRRRPRAGSLDERRLRDY